MVQAAVQRAQYAPEQVKNDNTGTIKPLFLRLT